MAEQNPEIIKRRIEALVMGAQINAQNHGGDNATAAMDLLCALALISTKSGAALDKVLSPAQVANAKEVVADFWPNQRLQ